MIENGICPFNWEGRAWINKGYTNDRNGINHRIKFLSYNVFSDAKCNGLLYTSNKSWDTRKTALINELKDYDADIMCLQDVDHFQDWWQPQLMLSGYDTVWRQRTREAEDHYEGVIIAFKRDLFQLFKTVEVDLNNCWEVAEEGKDVRTSMRTDDVGIIVFLQPWTTNKVRTALCVGCCNFFDADGGSDIRLNQAIYFAKCVEISNRDFQVPVILGVSLHDGPNSLAYHLLRTGRTSLKPHVPRRCKPPKVTPFCRGSATLSWHPPALNILDPPILLYRISWRPGGSQTLSFKSNVAIADHDCIKYDTEIDELGKRRTVAHKDRFWTLTGLSSETPYEFRVQAVNSLGDGPWSEACEPVILPNPVHVR